MAVTKQSAMVSEATKPKTQQNSTTIDTVTKPSNRNQDVVTSVETKSNRDISMVAVDKIKATKGNETHTKPKKKAPANLVLAMTTSYKAP